MVKGKKVLDLRIELVRVTIWVEFGGEVSRMQVGCLQRVIELVLGGVLLAILLF